METEPRKSFVHLLYETIIPKIEMISILVLFVGLVMWYMQMKADFLLQVSLSVLSGVYFLTAFRPPVPSADPSQNTAPKGIAELLSYTIIPKILGISMAVGLIGIQFYLLDLPGYQPQLLISMTSSAGAVLLTFLFLPSEEELRSQRIKLGLKALLIAAVCVYLFLKTMPA